MIGPCPHPLLRVLDCAGTAAFPIEFARTLRDLVGADAVAVTEFGTQPSWTATIVEISRDPALLAPERLQLSRLAEPVFAPADAGAATWIREREIVAASAPATDERRVLRAVNTVLSQAAAGCIVATVAHVIEGDRTFAQSQTQIDQLGPVLRMLWHTHLRVVNLTTDRDALFEAIGQRGLGAITLDRRGAPISLNRRAAELMAASRALSLSPTRLVAVGCAEAKRLREALSAAISDLDRGMRPAMQSLTLVSEQTGDALRLQIHPIAAGLPQEGARAPAVVVLVQDLHRDIRPDVRANASRFALTPVELELACHLVDGRQLDAAAKHQRISIHTARKYLQQIFAKTGASRQAELVRLLISGAVARPQAPAARLSLRRIGDGTFHGAPPLQRGTHG